MKKLKRQICINLRYHAASFGSSQFTDSMKALEVLRDNNQLFNNHNYS